MDWYSWTGPLAGADPGGGGGGSRLPQVVTDTHGTCPVGQLYWSKSLSCHMRFYYSHPGAHTAQDFVVHFLGPPILNYWAEVPIYIGTTIINF